jgi:hypothetical protein
MISLPELQSRFADALLQEGALDDDFICPDGLSPDVRLDVYRNNVYVALSDLLDARFPVVRRVVGEQFFAFLTHAFIGEFPPASPILAAYGAKLPEFVAQFEPAAELPYLPDLARLEWLIFRARQAPDFSPLEVSALQGVPEDQLSTLRLSLDPSLGLLESAWPVGEIFDAHHQSVSEPRSVNLGNGGVRIEIRRVQGVVVGNVLPAGVFRFRRLLQEGHSLEAASETASQLDAEFDLGVSFVQLVRDQMVRGFGLTPDTTLIPVSNPEE